MSVQEVPFFRASIGEEERVAVDRVLRSGWLTTGAQAAAFEKAFAEILGGGVHCVSVNSATAAMHLALEAFGIGEGDEVICPTFTFTATAEVIRYLGARPVLIDVDEKTFNITPEAIEAAITENTKAVMPVHFAGLPADMTGIRAVADKHNLKVLDDAAHALPTKHKGELVGTVGADATAFSFYANKTMTTGEGGMLVTRDEDVAKRARVMRLHGIDRDVFNRFTDTKAAWQYDIVAPGFKYNLTDIAAALGLCQLRKIDAFNTLRGKLAQRYHEKLAGLPVILPTGPADGDSHSWHLYIIRLTDRAPLKRDTLINALKEKNVGCSVHYTPLHKMTYWQKFVDTGTQDFPNANLIGENCVSIPLYMDMREDEQDRVIEVLHELLGG